MRVRAIVANYADGEPVRRALGQLHAAGVERDDISLLMAEDGEHSSRFGLIAGHKGADGAALGAALGGVLGGVIGALAGLGDIAGPGTAALELTVATLAGMGLGGGLGGILGGIVGLRVPEYRPKLVDATTNAGRVMIAVWVTDNARAERVTRILAR